MRTLLGAWLLLACWTMSPAEAQEKSGNSPSVAQIPPKVFQKEDGPDKGKEAKGPAPTFPGLADVVPKAAELTKQAAEAETLIASSTDTSIAEKQIREAEASLEKLRRRTAEMGDQRDWDDTRLLDARVLFINERKKLEGFLDPLSSRLADLESLRREWEERQVFWLEWKKALRAAQVEPPMETVREVEDTCKRVLQEISDASALLVGLQQRITRLIEENRLLSAPMEAALTRLRNETFRKTEPSFISRAFYQQFDATLWRGVYDGLTSALKAAPNSLYGYGWAMLLQVVLIFSVGSLAMRQRRSPERRGQWWGMMEHPWALGIFVAGIVSVLALQEPTGLWRFLARSIFVCSAAILILAPVVDHGKRHVILVLAAVSVLFVFLKAISFPTVLYRLSLTLVSLVGFRMFSLSVRRDVLEKGRKKGLFSFGLWMGSLCMATVFLAQVSGYANLSDHLIFAAIWTVFLGISVVLALRITHLGIDLMLSRPIVSQQRVVREFGSELRARVNALVQILIWTLAILFFFATWDVFDSASQAWEKLFQLRFAVGGLSLSLGLIVVAVMVLYLSTWISWFLRTFLEAEVFPRRELDSGARDAITKLLHYLLVLVGFLLSMSVLGIDLKSFVLLGGALGIGLGFGLQNIVNNFVSGLILLFERPVKVGDMVEVDNESGRVKKIGLRSTIIETFDRSALIVPNSHLISRSVTNWTLTSPMARLKIPVGVAYGSDVELALRLLKDAAGANRRILRNPEPLPLFVRFGENALEFELQVWIPDVKEMLLARSEIGQEIDRRLREAGVEIPYPQRVVHLRSAGNETKDETAGG